MGAADRLMPSLLSCSSLLEASGTQSQGRWGDCEYQATCTPPAPGQEALSLLAVCERSRVALEPHVVAAGDAGPSRSLCTLGGVAVLWGRRSW